MRIAIFGYYNALNAGDDRLQYCLTYLFRRAGHQIVFLPHFEAPPVELLRTFDWAILGGGGLVFERVGVWKDMKKWIRKSGVRVGALGLGVNRLEGDLRRELEDFCAIADFVYVRDQSSKDLLGPGSRAEVYPDLSWLCPLERPSVFPAPLLAPRAMAGPSGVRVALNFAPCPWQPFEAEAWMRQLEGYSILPFPLNMLGSQDLGLLEKLTGAKLPEEFSAQPLWEAQVLVASRFHAIVFAAMLGTPFLAIAYDYKVRRLCEEMNLNRYCLDTSQAEECGPRLRELLENYTAVRESLLDFGGRQAGRVQDMRQALKGFGLLR